jgi:hypothetical protein
MMCTMKLVAPLMEKLVEDLPKKSLKALIHGPGQAYYGTRPGIIILFQPTVSAIRTRL